ncbi:MAG: RluA family pseudouridine synthase [Pseudomonadota bacterium]|nr:RluA family pseudouridine synthase [Pseudomonadota bacterium]
MVDEAGENDDGEAEIRHGAVPTALDGARLDKALAALVPELSRTYLQALVRAGHASVDAAVVTSPAQRVREAQALRVELLPTAQSQAYRAEDLPLVVVYEDAHLLVVDKAAGMVVHPAAGNWSGTLLNALLGRDPGAAALPRAGIVHRLDKDTSGLLVVGKNILAVTALSRAIGQREVQRRYLAIAHGSAPKAEFSVDAAIGRDARRRTRMAISASGKPARTDFQRLVVAAGCVGLRCTLHSGRTHQIRVHLSSLGLPLVGDALYGGSAALGMQRQALHAAELGFAHPVDGRLLALASPLPADMAVAWTALQAPAA